MKWCNKCKQHKNHTEFYRSSKNNDGYQLWCKACMTQAAKDKKARDKLYKKHPELKPPPNGRYTKPWLTPEVRALARYGKCPICRHYKNLVRDHDHKTNKFRGMICSTCNTGLGLFYDNPGLLRNAIEYLKTE